MLNALTDFSFRTPTTIARTPRLYISIRDAETTIQVHEDFSDATDLRAVLLPSTARDHDQMSSLFSSPLDLGRKIGSWLRGFHTWADAPAQESLRREIGRNQPMRKLKHRVNYGNLIGILEKFLDVVGCSSEDMEALQNVRDVADKELARPPTVMGEYWGMIHGDFCMLK